MEDAPEDVFGAKGVFNEERLAALKGMANEQYTLMSNAVKKAEQVVSAAMEFVTLAETNAKEFHSTSKAYVATLKLIEEENTKPKF